MYGNAAGGGDSCMRATDEKYGFRLIGDGCRTKDRKIRKNQKILLLLDKQNGQNWRAQYRIEYKACRKDNPPYIWFDREYYMQVDGKFIYYL